jgi:AcrR family transcriptional regulator
VSQPLAACPSSAGTDCIVGRPGRRRDELLALAAALFAARGFHSVTMDDIGAAADISGPALYHHFRSKESMLGEMLVGISQRLLDGVVAVAATTPVDSLLDPLIDFHCDFAVTEPSLITVHFRDLIHAPPDDQATVRSLQGRYIDIWRGALLARSPRLDVAVADAAVRSVFGLINSTPYSHTLPPEQMRSLLCSLAHGALAARLDH